MLALIVDCETSNITRDEAGRAHGELLEFAAILYDIENHDQIINFSALYSTKSWDIESADVHGISQEAAKKYGRSAKETTMDFKYLANLLRLDEVKYVIAHNAFFDKTTLHKAGFSQLSEKEWLCSFRDFEYPSKVKSKSLINIAASLRIPVINAHRALSDCEMLYGVALTQDLDEAKSRKYSKVRAVIGGRYNESLINYVKEKGYMWDRNNTVWFKETDENDEELNEVRSKIDSSVWTFRTERSEPDY